jgi:transglutaminase-like putative cysteine protease
MVAPTTNGEPASSRVTDFKWRPLKTPDCLTLNGLGATAGIAASPDSDQASCLHCRDFSAADAHAALFLRANYSGVPDPLTQLVADLTAPFDASLTDKACVIFTWMHHNISYDAYVFHTHTIKPGQTAETTLASGLAVCSGYAGLYAALMTKAGLECVVVYGHGKGYGFKPHQAEQMIVSG